MKCLLSHCTNDADYYLNNGHTKAMHECKLGPICNSHKNKGDYCSPFCERIDEFKKFNEEFARKEGFIK